MQINKRSVFTRVLLVLYPVCSQKGGLLIIELFNHHQILNLGLTAVTIWRLLDNGLVFEYTLRKTIHIHNNLYFIYLTPAYFYATHLTFFWHYFFLFAMAFISLARNKAKKYLPISHRIINYQTFFGLHYCISTHIGPMPPFQ